MLIEGFDNLASDFFLKIRSAYNTCISSAFDYMFGHQKDGFSMTGQRMTDRFLLVLHAAFLHCI